MYSPTLKAKKKIPIASVPDDKNAKIISRFSDLSLVL